MAYFIHNWMIFNGPFSSIFGLGTYLLLADYSDEKLTEIRRRFEENQDGDIVREEVERSLREKG